LYGLGQKIDQQANVYKRATQELASAKSVTYLPLSHLFAEAGITEAVQGLMGACFMVCKAHTVILKDYDLKSLEEVKLADMLHLFSTMQPKSKAE
jgi:hypothetical protein